MRAGSSLAAPTTSWQENAWPGRASIGWLSACDPGAGIRVISSDAQREPQARPDGRYYSAVFDAATLVNLEAGIGPHSPPVPLRTLGPVLNLTQASSGHQPAGRPGVAG